MPARVIDVRQVEDLRDVVHQAVEVLTGGQLVAFPTETVYVVAARALEPRAVRRLLELKGRPEEHPLTLALYSAAQARDYVPDMSRLAQRLARRCWPGPVTLVLPDSHPEGLSRRLPPEVQKAVSAQGRLGLRVPGHPLIMEVLRMMAGPLVLSSAKRTGQPHARTAQEVIKQFGEEVALILDDGPTRFGQPSAVVQVEGCQYRILRPGVVPAEAIKRLASLLILFVCTGNTCRSPMAEALARKMLADRLGCPIDQLEEAGVMVSSAGIAAVLGAQASPEAIEVMQSYGIELKDHETQPVNETLIRHADYIFTMTHSHRQAIVDQWPEAAERTLLLSPEGIDIADPIGGSVERYRRCAQQIHRALAVRLQEVELP
ncbi:MAG: L-threonylcarbamoyladenylate synthase [Thermoguttaceae bacterium]|nr:L-threonylcarbamoyladenylate synthase [Thermoguttaceae bacterium]MDW8036558.1 L-threonylcarbamoyladenylate synthase [Thermoguttaceae bacterium]